MTFQPYPNRSGFFLLAIALITGAIAVYLATLIVEQRTPPDIFKLSAAALLALIVAAMALYWALIAFKLNYHLDRNGLAIQWGWAQQRLIPFESIEKIIPGQMLPNPRSKGLNLAGLRIGRSELADYGSIKHCRTANTANSLLVVTADQSYLISPRQPDDFIRAWQVRQKLGPTQEWTAGIRRSWPLNISFMTDPLTWWLLGLSLLACLALFGYLSLTFPTLPPSLPIHFNPFGRADRTANKITLLVLPAAGIIGLAFNGLLGGLIYKWEKVAAYLLWGSALVIQMFLWVAAWTITATG